MFQTSVVYAANYHSTEDIIVNQGGTSSGKTYSILQVLFTKAVQGSADPNKVITIVGQDIPNLKAGALKDALDIINASPVLKSFITHYNKTDRVLTFKSGYIMEFKSYQNAQDAKSGKRQYLFINEANGISMAVYDQLAMRTSKQIFIDYNPDAEFWVHENILSDTTLNVKLFISDHRHNPFVPEKTREKIEALRHKDKELFRVYGRGLTGKIEGLIFRNYTIVPDVPLGAKLIGDWLDFGFSNDPTSFGKVYEFNKELYLDELIYETGMLNSHIRDRWIQLGVTRHEDIIADSADPKSIAELQGYGFRVSPAKKGPDSIRHSIDTLKQYPLNITERSVGLKKEVRTYKWATDKTGKTLYPPEPVDFQNHSIDGVRYVALNKINKNLGHYSFM